PLPVLPIFMRHASWWPVQYHEPHHESNELVWLWIPKEDNIAYERRQSLKAHIVHKKRWCASRIKITCLERGRYKWFPIDLYFTVVSSIHSVMQAYPSRKIVYNRVRRHGVQGVRVKRLV